VPFNDFPDPFRGRHIRFAGDLLLVAIDAAERAGKLRDEHGDGVVFCFHGRRY
jgi:hypothetical protein